MKNLGEKNIIYTISKEFVLKVGLNEAIFIDALQKLVNESESFADGHRWIVKTYDDFQTEIFPFWSQRTVRRVVKSLEQQQLIITGNYNPSKVDRTKWYRLNYEELEKIYNREVELQDTELQEKDTNSVGNLSPETIKQIHQVFEDYSPKKVKQSGQAQLENEVNPYHFFEQNGFGTVGSYLAEKIQAWCEDLSPELVVEAMKVAIEGGAKRWNYVESVLRHWAERGYSTVGEVQAAMKQHREQMSKRSEPKTDPKPLPPKEFVLDLTLGEDM